MQILVELDRQVNILQNLAETTELNVTTLKSGLDLVGKEMKDIVTNVSCKFLKRLS